MKLISTPLEGCFVLKPTIYEDGRGYFFESFNQKKFEEATGLTIAFVQDNESLSSKGVLRGLHYQTGNNAQAKLVRVIKGRILDVAVDLRKDSPTFGKHFSIELSESNKEQLFIPKGFAHGFLVLSDTAIFAYKCDNFYNKESESGIIYNDPTFGIDWNFPENKMILSERDRSLPGFKEAVL